MFTKIMTPVDLGHTNRLGKALQVAADLAAKHDAEVCYVGVTTSAPSAAAHTPEEFHAKLTAFAEQQSNAHGHRSSAHSVLSNDPAVDLDHTLEKTVKEIGADLVVMATHMPGLGDHIWTGHGGHLAQHSGASVFLVRGE